MKHIIVVVIGLFFLISCGKDEKVNTTKKEIKQTKATVSKKEKTTKKKSCTKIYSFISRIIMILLENQWCLLVFFH